MSLLTIANQSKALLRRSLVDEKLSGGTDPKVEIRALLDSIILGLLSRPKAVKFVAQLAKRRLIQALQDEIDTIDSLTVDLDDLNNTSFKVRDSSRLNSAKSALRSINAGDELNVSGTAFTRFSNSVDKFLNEQLSKSVRRVGSTSMLRPSDEAKAAIPTDYAELLSRHEDTIDRFYSLSLIDDEFTKSPTAAVLGKTVLSRVMTEIDLILDQLEGDDSASEARNQVVRLLASRSALEVVGTAPSLSGPILSTVLELPVGYELTGTSAAAAAFVEGTDGTEANDGIIRFSLGASSPQVTVDVDGTTVGPLDFPQSTDFDVDDKAIVVGAVPTGGFPVTLGATTQDLYITLVTSGTAVSYRAAIGTGSQTLSAVVSAINTALTGVGTAAEFCASGTDRIIIRATSADVIRIDSAVEIATVAYTDSGHALLGFQDGKYGWSIANPDGGGTEIDIVVDAFNELFGSVATAVRVGDAVRVDSVSTSVGVTMTITSPSSLGIDGAVNGMSDEFRLLGLVRGVITDPVDPQDLLDVGDVVTTPTGSSTVASLTNTAVFLAAEVDTFSGSLTVNSALDSPFAALSTALDENLVVWSNTLFVDDMKRLDAAVAKVYGSIDRASTNEFRRLLVLLRAFMADLKTAISDSSTDIPAGCATRERALVNGIIESFEERNMDRALGLFLTGKLMDLFTIDLDEVSYAGRLAKGVEELARMDVEFEKQFEEGEKSRLRGYLDRTGL